MWRPITDFNSKRILQDFITSLQNTNSSEAERILFLAASFALVNLQPRARVSVQWFYTILYVSAPSHPPVKFIPWSWMKITITHSKHKTRNRPFDIVITGDDSWAFCHSFLTGAACHAADKGSGFFSAQIRALGRWKSDAFKFYIRNSTLQAIKFERVRQG